MIDGINENTEELLPDEPEAEEMPAESQELLNALRGQRASKGVQLDNLLVPCVSDEEIEFLDGTPEDAKAVIRIMDSVGRTVEQANHVLKAALAHARSANVYEKRTPLGTDIIRSMTIIRTAVKLSALLVNEALAACGHTYQTFGDIAVQFNEDGSKKDA